MSSSSLSYRPHLDGIRAVAVLMVFVFHAARPALVGGFIGVDVFFVLSGYLITRILLLETDSTGTVRLSEFYARRMRRLAPAVVVVVAAVAAWEAAFGSILTLGSRIRESVASLLYFANWNLIAQSDDYFVEGVVAASPLRHMWSLSLEEQFYVVWPLLLLAAVKLSATRRSRLVLIGVLTLGSIVAMATVFDPTYVARAYYGTDARIHQPLIGAMLAIAVHGRRWDHRWVRVSRFAAPGALVGLLLVAWVLTGENAWYYRGGSTVVALLACVLVAAVEAAPAARTARVLSSPPLRALGQISYGVYLWHWPVILWVSAPDGADLWARRGVNAVQLALSVGLATVSYWLVERPIRFRRLGLARLGAWRTVALGFLVLIVTALVTAASLEPDDGGLAAAALADPSVQACPENPRPCVKREPTRDDPVTIALVGDSTAQAYEPAIRELAEQHDLRYVQAAVGGCPIGHRLLATGVDGDLHKPSNHTCFEELPSIYEELLTRWDPDVILATSSNETSRHISGDDVIETGTPRHLAETEAALRAAVDTLVSEGAVLVFIDILPRGPGVECLDSGPPSNPRCVIPVDDGPRAPYLEMFGRIADERSEVGRISLTDVVCPDARCPLVVDGLVMRYDGGHLTGTASRRLAPDIDAALAALGVDLGMDRASFDAAALDR